MLGLRSVWTPRRSAVGTCARKRTDARRPVASRCSATRSTSSTRWSAHRAQLATAGVRTFPAGHGFRVVRALRALRYEPVQVAALQRLPDDPSNARPSALGLADGLGMPGCSS
jgi:hypothetical protein